MDPRHVLAAAGDRTADPELEERQHLRERAAARRQHDPGPRQRDPQLRVGLMRLVLPGDDDLGQEIRPGRRALIERLVALRAVVTGGRLGDEHARTLTVGQRVERADQIARRQHARFPDPALGRVGPALRDRLAQQVHDRVRSAQRVGRRGRSQRIRPRIDLGVGTEDAAAALGVARKRHHGVAASVERRRQRHSDRSRRSGDHDSHLLQPHLFGRISDMRSTPRVATVTDGYVKHNKVYR